MHVGVFWSVGGWGGGGGGKMAGGSGECTLFLGGENLQGEG